MGEIMFLLKHGLMADLKKKKVFLENYIFYKKDILDPINGNTSMNSLFSKI